MANGWLDLLADVSERTKQEPKREDRQGTHQVVGETPTTQQIGQEFVPTPDKIRVFAPSKRKVEAKDGFALELESGYMIVAYESGLFSAMLKGSIFPEHQSCWVFRVLQVGPMARFNVGDFVLMPSDQNRSLINLDEILVHQDNIAARVREKSAVEKDGEGLRQEKNRAEDALWDGDK